MRVPQRGGELHRLLTTGGGEQTTEGDVKAQITEGDVKAVEITPRTEMCLKMKNRI